MHVSDGHLKEAVISCKHDPAGTRICIGVRHILSYESELYVVGIRLQEIEGFLCCNQQEVCVLKMNSAVKRIGLLHDCSDKCVLSENQVMEHNGDVFSGERYKLLTTSDGYPPHNG